MLIYEFKNFKVPQSLKNLNILKVQSFQKKKNPTWAEAQMLKAKAHRRR